MIRIICVCEGHLQKKMHGTSNYTKYGRGGFLLIRFLYPFVGASFCTCCIPLGFPHHLICLPRTHTHMHVLCTQSRSTLVSAPILHLGSPHQIHIWKKGFYLALDLNWLWFGNSTHVYKFVKNVHLQYPFFPIKPWLLVECTTNQHLHNRYIMHGT
jgi:hypothetical protein